MKLEDIQKIQGEHDDIYYDHQKNELEDIRHAALHLAKLVGKLAQYCEPAEHGRDVDDERLKNEVTPDLLFWALHLANTFDINLEKQYLNRLQEAKKRIDQSRSK